MKVFIADIHSSTVNGKRTGHFIALARNYKELFGDDCIVAGGPVYKNSFKEEDLLVLPYNVVLGQNSLIVRFKNFVNAIRLFRKAKGQCIVLQQCATITLFFCILLFYHKRSRLFMIQYSLEGFRMGMGSLLYKLAKHKIDGLICPNDMVGKAYGIPYCVVPDYIYTKGALDRTALIPFKERKYDFGIIGRIAPGKGCVESAKILAGTKYKIIIAGRPQNQELENELKKACEGCDNIELRLGFISDEEYKYLMNQCRYSLLNYQEEYSRRSSGVVFDMLFSGIPVVGNHCLALDFIGEKKLGCLYDSLDDFDLDSIMDEKLYNSYLDNIVEYCTSHGQYKKKLSEFLLQ